MGGRLRQPHPHEGRSLAAACAQRQHLQSPVTDEARESHGFVEILEPRRTPRAPSARWPGPTGRERASRHPMRGRTSRDIARGAPRHRPRRTGPRPAHRPAGGRGPLAASPRRRPHGRRPPPADRSADRPRARGGPAGRGPGWSRRAPPGSGRWRTRSPGPDATSSRAASASSPRLSTTGSGSPSRRATIAGGKDAPSTDPARSSSSTPARSGRPGRPPRPAASAAVPPRRRQRAQGLDDEEGVAPGALLHRLGQLGLAGRGGQSARLRRPTGRPARAGSQRRPGPGGRLGPRRCGSSRSS